MNAESLIKDLTGGLFACPVAFLLRRGVAQSATAVAMCRRLEGKKLQLDPGSEALAAWFAVDEGELRLNPGLVENPDATLSGTPLNLARLSTADPQAVIREGAVKVSGDSDVAEQFQYLLSLLRPDWEEELSRVTGDAIAHETGNAARGFAGWSRQARRSLGRSLAEYLTEESAALATRAEIEEFCTAVDELTLAADRLEAHLNLLRSARNKAQPEKDQN